MVCFREIIRDNCFPLVYLGVLLVLFRFFASLFPLFCLSSDCPRSHDVGLQNLRPEYVRETQSPHTHKGNGRVSEVQSESADSKEANAGQRLRVSCQTSKGSRKTYLSRHTSGYDCKACKARDNRGERIGVLLT